MFYTLQNETLRVVINECGAELWSIYDKTQQVEHLWQGEASIWMQRAPMLFPVVGRMWASSYTLNGNEYTLAMYGFARDCIHELVSQTDTSLRLRLVADEKTRKQYPFDFQLDTVYTLNGNHLTHAFEVKNTGDVTLPFSIGYHTGYRCFHAADETIKDCELRFDIAEPGVIAFDETRVAAGKASILSDDGKTMQLENGLFTKAVTTTKESNTVTFYNRATKRGVQVTAKATDYARMLLWSGGDDLPFLCIEPWNGIPEQPEQAPYGDFTNKPGLTHLPTGETYHCAQEITILAPQ